MVTEEYDDDDDEVLGEEAETFQRTTVQRLVVSSQFMCALGAGGLLGARSI
jgi:hypothetical protein